MVTKPSANFLSEFPMWSKVLLQLGFAGVIGGLFISDSRDRSSQLRDMQIENRTQAKDDRDIFRQELKAQRDELKNAVGAMNRAVDVMSKQSTKNDEN